MHTRPARPNLLSAPVWCALIPGILLTAGGAALAADSSPNQMMPSKEMREKMATLHEQMAACLRSDKSFSECRQEMMTSCQATMGTQGCSMMMGMGNMGHSGHMGGTGQGTHNHSHASSSPPASSPPQ